MKKLAMLAVTVAALVLTAGKAEAAGNLVLNISGSVQYQVSGSTLVGKAKTVSFNNTTIYNLISNAVAHAANGIATNLPAKGIIEYDPEDSDGLNNGFFYVTDKAGDFYYQLSGFDANSNYYSFIELSSYIIITDEDNLQIGFSDPFDGSASYSLNASGNGTLSGKATALLFVHDNPYVYDIADSPDNFYGFDNPDYGLQSNGTAFEIQGVMTVSLKYQSNSIDGGSLSLSGTGNAKIDGNYDASVISGKASLK
jgi:hypothetical protein